MKIESVGIYGDREDCGDLRFTILNYALNALSGVIIVH